MSHPKILQQAAAGIQPTTFQLVNDPLLPPESSRSMSSQSWLWKQLKTVSAAVCMFLVSFFIRFVLVWILFSHLFSQMCCVFKSVFPLSYTVVFPCPPRHPLCSLKLRVHPHFYISLFLSFLLPLDFGFWTFGHQFIIKAHFLLSNLPTCICVCVRDRIHCQQ